MQLYEEMKNSLGNSIDRFPSYSVKLKKKKKAAAVNSGTVLILVCYVFCKRKEQ